MSTLKAPIQLETAFNVYVVTEQLGQGGAGRVYGGVDAVNTPIAVKVLTSTTSDKRRRFKNEIAFLARNNHPHIVSVTDYGMASAPGLKGPFYVMPRFEGSLRELLHQQISHERAMRLFSQILDGVEAAHLQGVTHRDLKPENVLFVAKGDVAAVADFGIASFLRNCFIRLWKQLLRPDWQISSTLRLNSAARAAM